MVGKKKRGPLPKNLGAAAAKQMGLFVGMDPEEMMMCMEENLDDPDLGLKAELARNKVVAAWGRANQKAKPPLPMEDIAKMADECMYVDEDEDENDLEDNKDLLAEIQEVVVKGEADDIETPSSTSFAAAESSQAVTPESPPSQHPNVAFVKQQEEKVPSAAYGSLQHTLEERITIYKTVFLQYAKTAGETSKARRYDQGLTTLQSMLAAVKKERPASEEEIPPPVGPGALSAPSQPAAPPVPTPPESAPLEGELESTKPIPDSEEEQTPSECAEEELFVDGLIRGSPLSAKLRERIVDQFKKNIPQRKIAKNLGLSPSTVHNIVKRFRESGETSLRKGQGRKRLLNVRDLQAFRQHCMTNPDATVLNIANWAREYFGKPMSVNTVRRYIQICN